MGRLSRALGLAALVAIPVHATEWYDAPAVKALHAAARAEGKLVLWGPIPRELDWEAEPFAARFPGIKIEWYADSNAATKAIAEARSGRHVLDVFHHSLGGLIPLAARDLLAPIDWSLFGIGRDTTFEGRAAFTHNAVFVFAYNTQRVTMADVPSRWEDVLDSRWHGKLAGSQTLLPRLVGLLGLVWGEARALGFARDLVGTTGILVTRAPRESFLQSGERIASVAETVNSARLWASQGIAIGYAIPEPVAAAQFAIAVLSRAPHPNAARLFAGWLASSDGKRARDRLRFDVDVRPGSEHPIYRELAARNAKIVYETPANMAERDAIFRKAVPVIARQR